MQNRIVCAGFCWSATGGTEDVSREYPLLCAERALTYAGCGALVVDLTAATPYQISRDGEAVVIYFETPSATPVDRIKRDNSDVAAE